MAFNSDSRVLLADHFQFQQHSPLWHVVTHRVACLASHGLHAWGCVLGPGHTSVQHQCPSVYCIIAQAARGKVRGDMYVVPRNRCLSPGPSCRHVEARISGLALHEPSLVEESQQALKTWHGFLGGAWACVFLGALWIWGWKARAPKRQPLVNLAWIFPRPKTSVPPRRNSREKNPCGRVKNPWKIRHKSSLTGKDFHFRIHASEVISNTACNLHDHDDGVRSSRRDSCM